MSKVSAQIFIDALHRLEEQQDLDTIAGLYAEGAEVSNPVVPHHHRGLPGARDFWQGYRSTFREIHSEFHNVLDDGRTAMLEWTSSGRANDGREFSYRGVSVLEYGEDGIRAFRAYFDPRYLGTQLAVPQAPQSGYPETVLSDGFSS